jgi:hypothetical protein
MINNSLKLFLSGMVLVLILAIPAAAESSTITSISPEVGYTGSTTTVTIIGTDFNTSAVHVRLMMDDKSNITATITSHTSTKIVCKFTLSSAKSKGDWDLVVVNEDGSEVVASEGFTIRPPMKLTAISPELAQANDDDVEFSVDGSGLAEVTSLYLSDSTYGTVTGVLDDVDSTGVTGTFDLTDATDGDYEVCVEDDFGTVECDLGFEVTTDEVGEIDISSTPSGASIYVDSEYMGTTPDVIEELAEGYHKVSLVKAGYNDWGKLVKVTSGDTTTIEAELDTITLVTTMRTQEPVTTTPTPTPEPVATTRVTSSYTVPTPWPTTTTTTQESPVGIPVILAGLGVAVLALRR